MNTLFEQIANELNASILRIGERTDAVYMTTIPPLFLRTGGYQLKDKISVSVNYPHDTIKQKARIYSTSRSPQVLAKAIKRDVLKPNEDRYMQTVSMQNEIKQKEGARIALTQELAKSYGGTIDHYNDYRFFLPNFTGSAEIDFNGDTIYFKLHGVDITTARKILAVLSSEK
ncbi:MAG: hypothetical protein ACYCOU_16235 [Sulfobacillus sp.]